MKTRFNVQKEELDSYLQNAIMLIETLQDLKFERAEDWTMKNQGYALHFKGSLYKHENQSYDESVANISAQFPSDFGGINSFFEDLDCKGNNEWIVYISYNKEYSEVYKMADGGFDIKDY